MLMLLLLTTCSAIIFLYCFFGKMAHDSFEQMSDCLYECDWHVFSYDVKRHILFMITNIQRPLYYHGFGVAILELETFVKVNLN